MKPGSVTGFPVVTSDYLPTILDAIEVDYAGERPLDGISLLPVISGVATERDQGIGFQSAKSLAWTPQRYKLHSNNSGKSWELYDLIDDPSETADMAKEFPELVARLAKDLAGWRASCKQSDQGKDYP